MSAIEEIEAAIVKLTELHHAAPAGPWGYTDDGDGYSIQGSDDYGHEFCNSFTWSDNSYASDLIVTLHRTIDAQLAILRHVAMHYSGDLGIGTNRHVIALAHAINGDSK
jgi:hypothetical protein